MRNEYGILTDPTMTTVLKNNIEQESLSVRITGSTAAPTIPIVPIYEDYLTGTPMESLINREAEKIHQSLSNVPELPVLSLEEARKHILLTVINKAQNEKLLSDVPHFDICDGELSAIPRWFISDEASFIVRNSIAAHIGLTPDEVLRIGQDNINRETFETVGIGELLSAMMGAELDEEMDMPAPMIVMTSANHIQGARALLSEEAMNRVHDMIGDFIVIPSSIQEVICIPRSAVNADDIREMVHEVNITQVALEDRLSDNIFEYDGHSLSLIKEDLKMTAEIKDELIPELIVSQRISM